ncbi:MAG: flavohemoglobin expression-modulating QEGLA motif protein [Gammaproteobacteria bacterium]|nr:flavohemoglobin expression-modulating QEGLA motif protein [Gammaproteobacteria bacterium]
MAAIPDQEAYRQTVRALSDRIVDAQRPIRILDAIKWDASVQEAFFASGCREQPPVDQDYYRDRPLSFDPVETRREFHEIDREITRRLGQFNPLAVLMRRICDEYQMVVRMLEARGTPEFARLSEDLYGSASDVFHAGDPTLADLGVMMTEALENIDDSKMLAEEEKTITGEQAVTILKQRLDAAFPDVEGGVRVILSDGILADAAAGSDYLKIRKEARFNERDLRVLEVHEGWVHIGTTLNGQEQPVCTFLGKGPPSATITQEGLAIIVEVISFASYPERLRRVTNRIRAIDLAEQGATFVDVYQYFREQGYKEGESYGHASRIFRGSLPDAGPFTKDLAYSKGFILIYNFLRLAVRKGMLDRIPLLFCGKTTLEDIKTLAQLVEEGLVAKPRYLPPQFKDLNALTAWMCYSNFLNRLSLQKIEVDYANIL